MTESGSQYLMVEGWVSGSLYAESGIFISKPKALVETNGLDAFLCLSN